MKKVFLLLAIGSFAISSFAQDLQQSSVIFNNRNFKAYAVEANVTKHDLSQSKHVASSNEIINHSSEKTTTGGSRWYLFDSVCVANWGGLTNYQEGLYQFWDDSTAVFQNGGSTPATYDTNILQSIGLSLNPFYPKYNSVSLFPGQIKVSSTDAYTIDSVYVAGYYLRNTSTTHKKNVVDTMILSFVYGNTNDTGSINLPTYHYTGLNIVDTDYSFYGGLGVKWLGLAHDTYNNIAWSGYDTAVHRVVYIYTIPEGDSTRNGLQFPVSVSIPAGNKVAMSFNFKSGDSLYHSFDTVSTTSLLKYSTFLPIIASRGTATAAAFPTYDSTAYENGYYIFSKAQTTYTTDFATATNFYTSTPSTLQYPIIDFHVNCATCALITAGIEKNIQTISEINAFPNPTANELTIAFTLTQNANATVSLTNLLGQEVAAQQVNGVNNVNAVFQTKNIASGVYIYTVQTSTGERTTGRIVVAH